MAAWPLPFSGRRAAVYLQQPGVQQQRVGRLRVVVAFFVEVAELVEVPGGEQRVRHITQAHSLTSGPAGGARGCSKWSEHLNASCFSRELGLTGGGGKQEEGFIQ